mmetsp:Transcript_29866/g.64257  ORF Transcript_29866/g.64257 Transcript_29866/m.64257 type:complete len:215 (+) Transcript_29866:311-955(+)
MTLARSSPERCAPPSTSMCTVRGLKSTRMSRARWPPRSPTDKMSSSPVSSHEKSPTLPDATSLPSRERRYVSMSSSSLSTSGPSSQSKSSTSYRSVALAGTTFPAPTSPYAYLGETVSLATSPLRIVSTPRCRPSTILPALSWSSNGSVSCVRSKTVPFSKAQVYLTYTSAPQVGTFASTGALCSTSFLTPSSSVSDTPSPSLVESPSPDPQDS